jgi:hypothetical protein
MRTSNKAFTLVASLATALCLSAGAQAQLLDVNIYRTHLSDSGGGAPYADFAGDFSSPDIMFATNTGYNWHPFGLSDFGADILGGLNVVADGTYTFTLNSDDGSLLFIDGNLAVDNGGPHGPQVMSNSVFLTGGMHTMQVQFYEDFGGPSGVDLILPDGVSYADCNVPEPGSVALLVGMGTTGVGMVVRRRRRK